MNQKIDTDNAMVQNHNAIYQQLLDQIREDNTYTHAVITLNPYGTAPLSLYPVSELKAANRVSWSFWFLTTVITVPAKIISICRHRITTA